MTPSGEVGPGEAEGPVCDQGSSLFPPAFLPSMETLSDMFELDLPTVHSIISKMIINEELMVRVEVVNGGRESWRPDCKA